MSLRRTLLPIMAVLAVLTGFAAAAPAEEARLWAALRGGGLGVVGTIRTG